MRCLKWLNRSICRLRCRPGWAEGSTSSIVFARSRATWRIRLNCPSAATMRPYVNYFDHLFSFAVSVFLAQFYSKRPSMFTRSDRSRRPVASCKHNTIILPVKKCPCYIQCSSQKRYVCLCKFTTYDHTAQRLNVHGLRLTNSDISVN